MSLQLPDSKPEFGAARAKLVLADFYNLAEVDCRPLPGERDENYLIEVDGEKRFVLKISNPDEDPAILDAQIEMLEAIRDSGIEYCPGVMQNRLGEKITWVERDRQRFGFRLVSWFEGHVLSSIRFLSPELLNEWGRCVGQINNALIGFEHPAMHRPFHWDLAHASAVVASRVDAVDCAEQRDVIVELDRRFQRHTHSLLKQLPKSIIHNDANDGNLIVRGTGNSLIPDRICGLIDFGDAVYSWTIGDLAIAIAYAWLKTEDPIATARAVLAGYQSVRDVQLPEASALFGLACMRLCASRVIAAEQHRQQPQNDYLLISQAAVATTLPRLLDIPFEFANAAMRDMAKHPAVANHQSVVDHLGSDAFQPAFPLCNDSSCLLSTRREDDFLVLDLGVSSPFLAGDPAQLDEPDLTVSIVDAMRTASAKFGVGRYLEPRILYASDQFGNEDWSAERRTVHLGIDLFAAAGTTVVAPLDGVVFGTANIDRPLDYGGVLILQHTDHDNESFYTLYGHLDPKSIAEWQSGQTVTKGQIVARLGEPAVNGGWTPHLHFQVMLDLLELGMEFPGVCRDSQKKIWSQISPDPNLILKIPENLFPALAPDARSTHALRQKLVGGGLFPSYQRPVKFVRGWQQYLFDDSGRRFLDAYNNVPHVGHCHPGVTETINRQTRLLNSNTRYLHDNLNRLAYRVAATLPDPLKVCYFLNSASEANELALRLARTSTGFRDLVVLDGAYHGNTTTLIDISPYKAGGPGGNGCPNWVHSAPLPDIWRGAYRENESAGPACADSVARLLDRIPGDRGLCGFIAESCPSVAGQIIFPPDYLAEVYRHIRAAGGLCIADEVQTAYGRLGDVFYGFELQGVVPDIVVLGKPIGNGHPLAAVITTPEISAAFDNGMEFFSTFGGNSVSCAVGLAVLDIMEQENLQENARTTGNWLLNALQDLVHQYGIVADVRGRGFFIGVEFATDDASRSPASQSASFLVNRLRESGVLTGVDGTNHNVLKIRPPMCFSLDDAKILIESLDRALCQCPAWR